MIMPTEPTASDAQRATEMIAALVDAAFRMSRSGEGLWAAAGSPLARELTDARAAYEAARAALLSDRAALVKRVEGLRGGPEGPFENCHDCGRAMVWDNPDREMPTWMCPRCVCRRLGAKIAEVEPLDGRDANGAEV